MARSYYNKKVFNKKRAKIGRRMARKMIMPKYNGKLIQPVHYYTRFQDGGSITVSSATTSTFGVVYFELAAMPSYTEFSNLYDLYKIIAVKVNFIPVSNVSLEGSTIPTVLSTHSNRFFSVIDYVDRIVPTATNDLRQYSNCKVTPNNVTHSRYFHPRPVLAMDEDAGAGSSYGLGQTKNVWVATASNQCEWYGVKYAIEHGSISANTVAYVIEFKFYMAFKNVR